MWIQGFSFPLPPSFYCCLFSQSRVTALFLLSVTFVKTAFLALCKYAKMRRKNPGFGQLCLVSPVCISECRAKSLPHCQPVLGWLLVPPGCSAAGQLALELPLPFPRIWWRQHYELCHLFLMCGSGSGTEAPKHMAGEVSVAHVDLGRLFSMAFWEVFCGRASEYKRVTTANNNNETFCQKTCSDVLCVSWYPKWQPFVAWLEIRRVGFLDKVWAGFVFTLALYRVLQLEPGRLSLLNDRTGESQAAGGGGYMEHGMAWYHWYF